MESGERALFFELNQSTQRHKRHACESYPIPVFGRNWKSVRPWSAPIFRPIRLPTRSQRDDVAFCDTLCLSRVVASIRNCAKDVSYFGDTRQMWRYLPCRKNPSVVAAVTRSGPNTVVTTSTKAYDRRCESELEVDGRRRKKRCTSSVWLPLMDGLMAWQGRNVAQQGSS